MRTRSYNLVLITVLSALASACSPNRFVVNRLGNAISGDSSVYNSDNDPDLVREAIPFGLKTYESLLEVSPNHRGLLLSAASGFTSYAYLLQNEADRIDHRDYREASRLRARASNLYLRGRDYAFRGLSLKRSDFRERLVVDTAATLAATTKKDVAFLYWAGASWGGALSAAKDGADYVLSGQKTVVLNGDSADYFIVSARSDGGSRDATGISMFLVDAHSDGLSRRGYGTMDGLRAAELDLVVRLALIPNYQ